MIYVSIYQPRPYQANCMAALAQARKDGIQKGLIVMASGLGKTLTAIFDLQQFLQEHPCAHILCLCHQENILLQSQAKFCKFFGEEYSYGMYTGNYKSVSSVNFLFATFQTMRNYRSEFSPSDFDYVVVDEAHHTPAPTYRPTVDYFQPKFLLGLTATKDRMDGQDVLDTYGQILYQMDIYDGWIEGWLARVDYRIMLDDLNEAEFRKYVSPQVKGAKVSLSELNKTLFAPQHDQDIVASINEQIADLDNPSMFVFCPTIEHANAMACQFGDKSAVIHSGQSDELNESVLSKFRAGDLRILISVNMLNEGIDVPEADAVIFLRATESSTVFLQQLGRGLRLSDKKRAVRVLDYVANLERVATILTMEETAKKRIAAIPSDSITDKPDPIIVNIPATKFQVKRVDIETLISKIARRRHWTKAEIEDISKQIARELGRDLTIYDFRTDPRLPWENAIYDLYGSWPDFCAVVGFKSRRPPAKHWTPETVKRAILDYAVDGVMPSSKELDRNPNLPGLATVMLHIAPAMSEICQVLGLLPPSTRSKTDRDILSEYHSAAKDLGEWPSSRQLGRAGYGICTDATLKSRFGSIEKARALAIELFGPIPEKNDLLASVLDSSTIAILQNAVRTYGRRLLCKDLVSSKGLPCKTYFTKRGLGMDALNELIDADQILAELEQKNS